MCLKIVSEVDTKNQKLIPKPNAVENSSMEWSTPNHLPLTVSAVVSIKRCVPLLEFDFVSHAKFEINKE